MLSQQLQILFQKKIYCLLLEFNNSEKKEFHVKPAGRSDSSSM